ncbi:autotransporter outer membrane beta-barrel domain-containing protein [Mesorhizobium sp. BR1-1-2]|uniref:autotransporter outer membrane beta-barrel domain-containing protein n=1 Tax=Mesorhizobium sp. BR1-1-2 TaxID=2876652 RepID=UPI001CCEDFE7|nr:autotransporter domain-containing protein [Mesorhizobium sp. BR1-1-2]MBZ9967805.1 autotransporter domain-containing protein [Mesorhizobium sp. BR1-1-2]
MASTALILAGMATSSAFAADYLVGNEAELRSALATQANGDTIILSNDITLTAGGGGNLPEVHSDVTISGGGHTLSGGGDYRGLFVTSGTVRVENLTISNALAQGGTSIYGGGGGAGLGGALFINAGATVTVSDVDLSDNKAKGGEGPTGLVTNQGGPGGGGLVGDGGVELSNAAGDGGGPNGGPSGEGGGSASKSDSYHLGLYGGTNWGAVAFRAGAAYSWSSLSTQRSVAFNGFTDGLSADYDAGTAQVFGELVYKADAGQFELEPFADLAYVSVHTDGSSETGGDAALTSAGSTTDATFTTLGVRGSTDVALGGINATARGRLGWRHAFGDSAPQSTLAFAGGDQFTIAGVPITGDTAIIEAGLDLKMAANAILGLSYSGQFGGGSVDNSARVNLGVKF